LRAGLGDLATSSHRCLQAANRLNFRRGAHDTEGDGFLLKMIGVVVAIALGVLAVWWLVDMAWYLWGGLGALIFGFLFVFFLAYLVDRRKIKESEDLIAERKGLG
jgi:membrane protein implicated in regulation of membrane protease activity